MPDCPKAYICPSVYTSSRLFICLDSRQALTACASTRTIVCLFSVITRMHRNKQVYAIDTHCEDSLGDYLFRLVVQKMSFLPRNPTRSSLASSHRPSHVLFLELVVAVGWPQPVPLQLFVYKLRETENGETKKTTTKSRSETQKVRPRGQYL